jgi:hypothetical protein
MRRSAVMPADEACEMQTMQTMQTIVAENKTTTIQYLHYIPILIIASSIDVADS